MSPGLRGGAITGPLELPRREPYRTWPGGLIVLAIIVVYVGGWEIADYEIEPDVQPIAAGSVQQVGPAVSFVPQDGWYLDTTDSTQDAVILIGQAGQFSVEVSPWEGTLAQEVDRQKARDEAYGGARLIGDDATFSAAGGLRGTTFSLVNPQDQGRVWISVDETADRAVSIVGRAPGSSFARSLADFETMVDSVRLER